MSRFFRGPLRALAASMGVKSTATLANPVRPPPPLPPPEQMVAQQQVQAPHPVILPGCMRVVDWCGGEGSSLETRIRLFNDCQLPMQPEVHNHAIFALVNDLWGEVGKLRKHLSDKEAKSVTKAREAEGKVKVRHSAKPRWGFWSARRNALLYEINEIARLQGHEGGAGGGATAVSGTPAEGATDAKSAGRSRSKKARDQC